MEVFISPSLFFYSEVILTRNELINIANDVKKDQKNSLRNIFLTYPQLLDMTNIELENFADELYITKDKILESLKAGKKLMINE